MVSGLIGGMLIRPVETNAGLGSTSDQFGSSSKSTSLHTTYLELHPKHKRITATGTYRQLPLQSAARAAIVMPAVFAFADQVIREADTVLFAAFGSLAMLVFADFTGPPRTRFAT